LRELVDNEVAVVGNELEFQGTLVGTLDEDVDGDGECGLVLLCT
jgi:hypothetical protein